MRLLNSFFSGRPKWWRWLAEALFFLAIFLAIQAWQKRAVVTGPAPEIAGSSVDGTALSLSGWRAAHPDRAMALYFWAEWCPICKGVAGSVDAVGEDWPVLTVAMQSGTATEVAAYLRGQGRNWPTLLDPDGLLAAAYGLRGVPAFIVLDRNGAIRFAEIGYTSEIGMRLRLWWANR